MGILSPDFVIATSEERNKFWSYFIITAISLNNDIHMFFETDVNTL